MTSRMGLCVLHEDSKIKCNILKGFIQIDICSALGSDNITRHSVGNKKDAL